MRSFAGLIRRTPPPKFSETAITDRHSDTTIFQLRAHWVRISWSIGSDKSFGHVPPVGVELSTSCVQGEHLSTRPGSPLTYFLWGWSGGAMVLGKLPVPGRPTILMIVGQGPIALAVGAGGSCLDIFTLFYPFSPLSPSLWETVRYRLKYCLKGPLNPKQQQQQPISS